MRFLVDLLTRSNSNLLQAGYLIFSLFTLVVAEKDEKKMILIESKRAILPYQLAKAETFGRKHSCGKAQN